MSAPAPQSPARRRFLTRWIDAARESQRLHEWQPLAAADPAALESGAGVLWGVWGDEPDDVFVVGDAGLVLHWDGRCWTPEPSGTELPLHSVWGQADGPVIAVGWMGVICERRAGRWAQVQGGDTDAGGRGYLGCRTNQPLFAVWGNALGEVWAVGDHGRIAHYDGQQWQELDSGVKGHLRGVVGLPDGALMVCGRHGLLIRREGDSWRPMQTGTDADLIHLWARGPDDIYALGGGHDPQTNRSVGCLLHFDGDHWSQVPARGQVERLRGMAGDAQDLVVVGDRGGIYRLSDGMIECIGQRGEQDLHDVALFPEHALAVGDLGTLLRSGDAATPDAEAIIHPVRRSRWRQVGTGITDHTLRAIWAAPSGRLFAVGEAGTILTSDGTRWEPMSVPTSFNLHGVWGSSERHVFACGAHGSVLHYDGEHWREVHRQNTDTTALAIKGFGPHDVFIVGDEGLVLRYDGADWRCLPSGTRSALYALWGPDADHLLAVGDFGLALRWNGSDLRAFQVGTESFLFGVWGRGLSDIHAAGQAGTLAHFDGTSWSLASAGTRADLLAIAGRPDRPTLAVGTRGTAFQAVSGPAGACRWVAEETGCDASLRALCADQDRGAYAVGDGGVILYRSWG